MLNILKPYLGYVYAGVAVVLLAAGGWAGAKIASSISADTISEQAQRIAELEASKASWDSVTADLQAQAAKAKVAAQAQREAAAQAGRALSATVHKTNAMRDSYDERLAAAKALAEKLAMAKCDIAQAVVPPQLMGY